MEALSKNKIKWIRSLRLKKNRDAEKLFVVEGTKMVQEIIDQWPDMIECIVSSDSAVQFEGTVYHCDETVMKSITTLKTHSSLLAIVRQPELKWEDHGIVLALDSIQDPGNMGTIIRTADWFGVTKIVCSNETVDIFNSKVIQSSMGSLFRIPVVYTNLEKFLKTSELPVYGAMMEGKSMYEFSPISSGIIVMGNEGNGISPEIEKCITEPIHIPGKGGAESLNVAIAAGILLSHLSNS